MSATAPTGGRPEGANPEAQSGRGPLTGVRVLELASVLMAPYATQLLGDLGADVIKVEEPEGDRNRLMGDGPHPQLSGIALNLHRNKRSVVLDVKHSEGRHALRRLLGSCDVFVTNLRPASLARLGLSYDQLRIELPSLIFCEAHGFRADSADANRPAFDDIIQALCGIPMLNAAVDGEARFPPILMADKVAGMFIAYGVLAAMVHRANHGTGQQVEVPMFDSVLAFTLTEHLARGTVPGNPPGYTRILTRNRGPHRTIDGWIALMPYTDKNWSDLFEAVGCGAMLEQPWHRDMRTRLLEADKVYGELKQIVLQRTTAEWLELCERLDIPASAVPSIAAIVEDPDAHRGQIREDFHPACGPYRQIAAPLIFSDSPLPHLARPAPLVGEQSRELLAEVGYSAEEIEALIARGVTVDAAAGAGTPAEVP